MAAKRRLSGPRDAGFMTAPLQHKAGPIRAHQRADAHGDSTNPRSQTGVGVSIISRTRIRNALISHENFFAHVFPARVLMTATGADEAPMKCVFGGSAKSGNGPAADGSRTRFFAAGMIAPCAIWIEAGVIILNAVDVTAFEIFARTNRPRLRARCAVSRRLPALMCTAHAPVARDRASLLKPLGFFHNLNTRCARAHLHAHTPHIASLSFSRSSAVLPSRSASISRVRF